MEDVFKKWLKRIWQFFRNLQEQGGIARKVYSRNVWREIGNSPDIYKKKVVQPGRRIFFAY